jgi:hypothetical protein
LDLQQLGEKIHRVAPFAVPEADGGWPCGFCGRLFPVRRSWRVTLARTGTVISCEDCAQVARRRRAGDGRRGSSISSGERTADDASHHRTVTQGRYETSADES